MSHPGRLEGKVAIITGAAMGLGEGIARKFVHEEAKVFLLDINSEQLQKVNASLPADQATSCHADVTSPSSWTHAVSKCLDHFGRLDIVVNNAGVVHRSSVCLGTSLMNSCSL